MTSDHARNLALDPTTSAGQLAEIATNRPDLRTLVAAHPHAYPELLAWLRALGDPAVVAAVDARSAAVRAPVIPAGPGASLPAPDLGSPALGDAAAPGAVTFVDEIPVPPRRRRTRLAVAGAAAGVAVLVGGGAFAVNHFVLDKINGSETPRAAFDQLVTGLENKDVLAMFGAMSPAEVSSLSGLVDETWTSTKRSVSPASITALTDMLDAVTVTTDGVATTETDLQDGLTKVEVTAGQITVDGDVERIGDSFLELYQDLVENNPELTTLIEASGGGEMPAPQELRDGLVEELKDAFPATGSFTELADAGDPFFVVTVKENDAWYVSPYLTAGEIAQVSGSGLAPRGTMLGEGMGSGFTSPAAAADGLVAALVAGDVDALIASLPLPERRLLSVYGAALEMEPLPVDVSGTFTATSTSKGRATLAPTNLAITSAGSPMAVTLDGPCITIVDEVPPKEGRICADEAPLLSDFRLADIGVIAVEEDGAWFVSPTETIVDAVSVVSAASTELQESGKLYDPKWFEERTTALFEHLATQPLFERIPWVGSY